MSGDTVLRKQPLYINVHKIIKKLVINVVLIPFHNMQIIEIKLLWLVDCLCKKKKEKYFFIDSFLLLFAYSIVTFNTIFYFSKLFFFSNLHNFVCDLRLLSSYNIVLTTRGWWLCSVIILAWSWKLSLLLSKSNPLIIKHFCNVE